MISELETAQDEWAKRRADAGCAQMKTESEAAETEVVVELVRELLLLHRTLDECLTKIQNTF